MTDLEINTTMAHLAGWREAFPRAKPAHPETQGGGILLPYRWVNEQTHKRRYDLPDYLVEANEVIALLEKLPAKLVDFYCATDRKPKWGIGIRDLPADRGISGVHAKADTFCRAACLALIEANARSPDAVAPTAVGS